MSAFRLALISMPWPLADRPSIQLGTLKSYLHAKKSDIEVDCFHPYLEVAELLGPWTYNNIAEQSWVAESVYGFLLNPDKHREIIDLVRREQRAKVNQIQLDLESISAQIENLHESRHLSLPWSSYDLIGLSLCHTQLTSSFYMIRAIRALHPECRIVIGGSSCAGELGRGLMEHMSEIDFAVSGEGELPLLELIDGLEKGDLESVDAAGLMWRSDEGQTKGGGLSQLTDLRELPMPDYESYFQEFNRQPNLKNLVPFLPVETSRGCWWHKVTSGSVDRACGFCNLNIQWEGYRSKQPTQVAREMKELARKHASPKFFFVDNNLDPSKLDALFDSIQALDRSFEIFTELRASVSRDQFIHMRQAGVTQVQVGIESLSSKLLHKINKGTTAIQNIEVMKHCEELDIQNLSNIMLGFPGSDAEDVAETLENLSFVALYQPLQIVPFWLGHNSPVFLDPGRYGVRGISNHPYYHRLLPNSLADSLSLMKKTYVGDRTEQQRLWRPVAREVKRWHEQYQSLRRQHFPLPLLSFRDVGDFLLVRRRTEGTKVETFRFRGPTRAIYRFCETRKPLREIQNQFSRFSSDQLQRFISDMVAKRLMFQEGKQVLSLAVNEDPYRVLLEMMKRTGNRHQSIECRNDGLSTGPEQV